MFHSFSFKDAAAVTPDDDNDLATPASALYVGVSGDLTVDMAGPLGNGQGGAGILFKSAPVGLLPIAVSRVLSTGTSATNIVALR